VGDVQFIFRNEEERKRFVRARREETRRKVERMRRDAEREAGEIGDENSFDTFGDNDGSLFGP